MFPLLLLLEMQRKGGLFLLQIPAVHNLLFSASGGQTQIYLTVTTNYAEIYFLVSVGQGEVSALYFLFSLQLPWMWMHWA